MRTISSKGSSAVKRANNELRITLTKVRAELATTKAALKKMQRDEAARLKHNRGVDRVIAKIESRLAKQQAETKRHEEDYEKAKASRENRSKISELVNGFLYFNPKEIFA